ncbi:hypothetical protein tloyanaT_26010 [Thalassotalea loyana]|uniref:Uncharacterized protein n=1 Tax=Thalassotalea loyana TaxID=280483 RepID=A0ABQ6HE20_9GAMM|nr:hypothetical protein [Thalassotalea loyana]GLX86348.1 hypothetical protein tloyanaT_26010 [Thalassotalea loyana]
MDNYNNKKTNKDVQEAKLLNLFKQKLAIHKQNKQQDFGDMLANLGNRDSQNGEQSIPKQGNDMTVDVGNVVTQPQPVNQINNNINMGGYYPPSPAAQPYAIIDNSHAANLIKLSDRLSVLLINSESKKQIEDVWADIHSLAETPPAIHDGINRIQLIRQEKYLQVENYLLKYIHQCESSLIDSLLEKNEELSKDSESFEQQGIHYEGKAYKAECKLHETTQKLNESNEIIKRYRKELEGYANEYRKLEQMFERLQDEHDKAVNELLYLRRSEPKSRAARLSCSTVSVINQYRDSKHEAAIDKHGDDDEMTTTFLDFKFESDDLISITAASKENVKTGKSELNVSFVLFGSHATELIAELFRQVSVELFKPIQKVGGTYVFDEFGWNDPHNQVDI